MAVLKIIYLQQMSGNKIAEVIFRKHTFQITGRISKRKDIDKEFNKYSKLLR